MSQEVAETERGAILVEDAALIRMMGMPVLEAVPSGGALYERTDPFILVHEGRFRLSEMAGKDTKHPHRGFDSSGPAASLPLERPLDFPQVRGTRWTNCLPDFF